MSIPCTPSLRAAITSARFFIPAPQSSGIPFAARTAFRTSSGFVVETDLFPPISSGGSNAIRSGLNRAIFFTIAAVGAQTSDIIPRSRSFSIECFMLRSGIGCSE